jgi:hypothetical protein
MKRYDEKLGLSKNYISDEGQRQIDDGTWYNTLTFANIHHPDDDIDGSKTNHYSSVAASNLSGAYKGRLRIKYSLLSPLCWANVVEEDRPYSDRPYSDRLYSIDGFYIKDGISYSAAATSAAVFIYGEKLLTADSPMPEKERLRD